MRKLSESVWGDIRKKSLGQEDRLEDDYKNLDMKGFCDYICSHYELVPKYDDGTGRVVAKGNDNYINVTLLGYNDSPGTSFFYLKLNKKIYGYVVKLNRRGAGMPIYKLLDKEYDFSEAEDSWDHIIKPKEGKVDYKFFLDVIDFIIDNVQPPEESIIRKK